MNWTVSRRVSLFGMTAALGLGLGLAAGSAAAQDLPGKGKTVRFAQSDSLGANYVTAQIILKALGDLGYETKLTTINTTLFFQAAAQGDLDFAADVNFPQRQPGYKAVEKDAMIVGEGLIGEGGVNGYLIDKKTADAHKITTLEQFKDPKIAVLFGAGKADLINCDPGWSCGDVVDFQLGKFGLNDTVKSVRGKYEALMVEAVARVRRGEPAFFYAWSPSWMVNALVPGKDVVWLPTPFEALPPNVNTTGSASVPGVQGCAGGADPCRMAMPSWNWRAVANRNFIAANPPVRALIEQIKFPRAQWAAWESSINESGKANTQMAKRADDWIAQNKGQYEQWLVAAKGAK